MRLVTNIFKVRNDTKDENDRRGCKNHHHVKEHSKSLSSWIDTEAEWENVSKRNDTEWESDKDPLGCGVFLVENVEKNDSCDNRNVKFECIKDEIGNPVGG